MNKRELTFELIGHETEDGRIYIDSPNLEGFHFVLGADEDPSEAMLPTLRTFMELYIQAEIQNIRPVETLRQYRQSRMDLPRGMARSRAYPFLAEVAAS